MNTPLARYRSTLQPDGFHGYTRDGSIRDGFFEGWYVKLVSADTKHRIAVIPGVFMSTEPDGPREAFVQVLDGATGRTWYFPYPVEQFEAATDRFEVSVGPNHFSKSGVTLDLPNGLRGQVNFTDAFDPWPVSAGEPGCMGWYAWVPFLECYHGVCSFGHGLAGGLEFEGQSWVFDAGRAYIEKDWGQAFPSGYVWMHTNHFSDSSTSLMASIAIIPWVRSEFRGFTVGLKHRGRLFRFTTYTGAKTVALDIDDASVNWVLQTKSGGRLEITADRPQGGLLHAPIRTEMHRRVEETLYARIACRLVAPDGSVILNDEGHVGGLEVHGDIPRLLSMK